MPRGASMCFLCGVFADQPRADCGFPDSYACVMAGCDSPAQSHFPAPKVLEPAVPLAITYEHLHAIAPQGRDALKLALARACTVLLPVYQIDSPLRAAHFLGQVCIETDYFRTLTEYASGTAYEGRRDLGNTQPGDGPRFRGRGPIQVTGRANFARVADRTGLPLLDQPERLAEPELGTLAACIWWHDAGLNTYADRDDASAVSRGVNRGDPRAAGRANHEADRIAATARAKDVLGVVGAVPAEGDRDPIRALQAALNARGYGPLLVDGIAGPATIAAVRAFQRSAGLAVDGIAGAKTLAALGLA